MNKLKKYRVKRGKSQSQLAKEVKVNRFYISKLERGAIAHPSLQLGLRLAKVLGCFVEDVWPLKKWNI